MTNHSTATLTMRYRLRTLLIFLTLAPPAIGFSYLAIAPGIRLLREVYGASPEEWRNLLSIPAGLVALAMVVVVGTSILRRIPSWQ
jgi:hypothetical protein